MKGLTLGLKEAFNLTLAHIHPLAAENAVLEDSIDRIAASDLLALVDSPSMDASRKDGYAVMTRDLADASAGSPAKLRLVGEIAAGGRQDITVQPGTAVRLLTGARIPAGADAVVAEEYVIRNGPDLFIDSAVAPGKNILPRGDDARARKSILKAGQKITPVVAGLLAAAGHRLIPVYKNPVVGIIGTGDELVEPGDPIADGQVYASNIVSLACWCRRYRMNPRMTIVRDDHDTILSALKAAAAETDAVITSGGAWTGDYDMVAHALDELGWKKVFHRIRIGPGKAVGFGILNEKPVFILPGGPPSNLMGFLQIALPGLLALSGHTSPALPAMPARLAAELTDGKSTWTDFFYGTLEFNGELPLFHPMKKRVRLSSIARATAVAAIPEGHDSLPEGTVVNVQILE